MFFARKYSASEEDSQDVMQEVFAKLWIIREDLHKYDNLTALSVQIIKNLSFNKIKRNKRKESIFEQFVYDSDNESNENKIEQKDGVKQLFRIVGKLPDLQQTVLRMKYVDDLDAEEIVQHAAMQYTLYNSLERYFLSDSCDYMPIVNEL